MSFLLRPTSRLPSTPSLARASTRLFSSTPTPQIARLTMVGRLGTDPEINETGKGQSVIKYVVGTSHGPKDNRQTSWFRVASFAPEGSSQRDYLMGLSKGTLVYLEGDATMRSYETAEGKSATSLSLVQTKLEVLKRATTNTETEGSSDSS